MTTTNFDYADPLITEIESYKNRLAMVEDERDYLMNNCDRYIEQLGDLKTQVDSLKQINNDLYTKHIQMREALRDIYKWNVESGEDAFAMQELASDVLMSKKLGEIK